MSWTIMGFRYFPFFIALVDSWRTMGWTWTLPPHYGLYCQTDHTSLEVYPTAHLILHLYTRHRQNSIFTGADQEDKFPRATSKWQGIKEIISSGFFLGHLLVVGTLDTSEFFCPTFTISTHWDIWSNFSSCFSPNPLALNGSFPTSSAHSPSLTSPIISIMHSTSMLCRLIQQCLGLSSSGKGPCHFYFHFARCHVYSQHCINNESWLKVDFLCVQVAKWKLVTSVSDFNVLTCNAYFIVIFVEKGNNSF